MSWNSRRNWRNPVVEELARLLAIVSRFICCALMPLAAVYKARIILAPFSRQWSVNSGQRLVPKARTTEEPSPAPPSPVIVHCSLSTVHCCSYPGQILGCNLVELGVEDGEGLLHHLRLALHDDQIQRTLNHILVGAFDGPLVDRGLP